jgi:DeoR/GlpR family transcriptional regulator of sugar metabolism
VRSNPPSGAYEVHPLRNNFIPGSRPQRARRKATRVTLVADHTKFGRVTLVSFGRIEAAHVLITEPAPPVPSSKPSAAGESR